MNSYNKLLTIAIPTYNRAATLERALCIIQPQLKDAAAMVEFIVSDNCSSDNTPNTVQRYIDNGMPIQYIKNKANIGIMLNIIQCYKLATSKYVWVIGDDDYLAEGALQFVLDILLNNKDYGLLFYTIKEASGYTEYNNKKDAFMNIQPLIGWVSGNIINKKHIDVYDFTGHEFIYNTPSRLNFNALINADYNVQICEKIFSSVAVAIKSSGGYNYFKETTIDIATMNHYRKIIKASYKCYEKYKHFMFITTLSQIENLFRKHAGNWETKKAWSYLLKCYWYVPYFYSFVIVSFFREKFPFLKKIKRSIKFFVKPASFIEQKVIQIADPLLEVKTIWRYSNPHNETIQATSFNHDQVFVGLKTTGDLYVYDDAHSGTVLFIGNNCSIGKNVHFLLHEASLETMSFNGNIIVGNNVKLGRDIIIYPGVHISDGAIILPGSIVTKNIPSNVMVIGNPVQMGEKERWYQRS